MLAEDGSEIVYFPSFIIEPIPRIPTNVTVMAPAKESEGRQVPRNRRGLEYEEQRRYATR